MKKFLLYFIIFSSLIIFCSCQLSDYNNQKPNNFYYTKCLNEEFEKNSDVTVSLFDTNLHKELDITSVGLSTLKNFIENLKQDNFIERPSDVPEMPPYKLFISFNDASSKYVINVFSTDLISIHKWDATYAEDYMNCDNIYKANNLFKLCEYVLNH